MSAMQVAGALVVLHSIVLLVGFRGQDRRVSQPRPAWLPSRSFRALWPIPLAVGLWFGQAWAFWVGLLLCGSFVLVQAFASLMLIRGGFFRGPGGLFRAAHFALSFGTMVAAFLVLALSSRMASS